MITFLPCFTFRESAEALDYRRLGKQRLEAKEILLNLDAGHGNWIDHPCTQMWKGYEGFLCLYGIAVCKEWVRRGYKDNQLPFFIERHQQPGTSFRDPWWRLMPNIYESHRSKLWQKNAKYYAHYGNIQKDMEYYWPTWEYNEHTNKGTGNKYVNGKWIFYNNGR